MGFREVRVYEVREVLRLWLRGDGYRAIERLAAVDRKTVRRYVAAAQELGIDRAGGESQLTDGFLGLVVERVRPHRQDRHGAAWHTLEAEAEQIRTWLEHDGLTVTKVGELLRRRGVVVPARTLERFASERCGPRRGRGVTVRVADGAPGDELQADFGRLGLLFDPDSGRRRVCHALICTACVSRHCFVWPTFAQTTAAVIEGLEAAWAFYGGVFRTLIPDNMAAIVEHADALDPRLCQAFVEYAQARGFVVDPARVRHPQDKARVEREVAYVRNSFFAGEHFIDLDDCRRRAAAWCETIAGLRIHGTTACRPAEHFALVEAPQLVAAPVEPYDLPHYARPKVHRDHHIEVDRALYSVPGNLIGHYVEVRADRELVRIFCRGALVKVHPRQPRGGRSTDPADLPAERSGYALRDLERLVATAAGHGPQIGAYAAALLDHPLPWTKMRQVYALLGLVKRFGAEPVADACARAAEVEVYSAGLIGRMLERETRRAIAAPAVAAPATRFVRHAEEFARSGGAR